MNYTESVQRAIDYIEEHLDEELELSSIAAEAYISVAQLYRVFYALTGHPVKDYIRKRRMSVAAGHLRNSKRPVEEIAWDSGFESYHSFAKVFKKIVGLTPASYRSAEIYFSFEPVRLSEQVSYKEEREQSELYPDVKVIRFMPEKVLTYLHVSEKEDGIEHEAFRNVYEKLNSKTKVRIFGHNTDLPDAGGVPRYGYRILIAGEGSFAQGALPEVPFDGGLYAVRKIAASPPETVQEGWNRLVSEWLPKSTFDIGTHQYIEEFIAYNGKVNRMNLYLPVRRKLHHEPIEVVERTEVNAFFCRGTGAEAQNIAERRLIDWHKGRAGEIGRTGQEKYYMSFHYGCNESDHYWWENGFLAADADFPGLEGLEEKCFGSGLYASCVTKTYGLLTGVLDRMHRWIAASGNYRLDEERQWFAEYHTFDGMDIERDTIVKIYIPVL